MRASPPAAVIVLHMLLAYSFHLYFISFHFIPFYARLFFLFVTVVVAVSGWCYELFYIHFKYAAYVFSGRRFEYLHAIAMSILRHFHCDSVCVPLSLCVCVPQITFGLLQMVSRLSNATKSRMRWQLAASQTSHNNRQNFAATSGAKNRQGHLLVPKKTFNREFD